MHAKTTPLYLTLIWAYRLTQKYHAQASPKPYPFSQSTSFLTILIRVERENPNSISLGVDCDVCGDDKRWDSKKRPCDQIDVQEVGQEAPVYQIRTSDDLAHRGRCNRTGSYDTRRQGRCEGERRSGMGDNWDKKSTFENRAGGRLQPKKDIARGRAQGTNFPMSHKPEVATKVLLLTQFLFLWFLFVYRLCKRRWT